MKIRLGFNWGQNGEFPITVDGTDHVFYSEEDALSFFKGFASHPSAYYIIRERGNFGTYPREENAEGRTPQEVYDQMSSDRRRQINGVWDIDGVYFRTPDYYKYKGGIPRTSSLAWG